MKKLIMLALVAATAFACGTPKTVQESRKVIKGYWNLDEVSYDSSGTFNVTMFNDTSAECFEGSMWRFIPNNNTGRYNIENSNCPTGERNFIFTIQEIDPTSGLYDFLLKPTNAKGKSDTNAGYRLRLTQLNENSMRWEQTVNLDGKPFKINMNFSKINE
ncbi:lipocalin family protein [Aequorivita sp. 609]|uniref:lipocalin family protein n=1 Tax=Aequorivita TaxID=153265 RepID=UPI00111ED88C|nr:MULTISPECIES: lipocalin family protein [Aequorivita]MBB6680445.1 lipocalin family protein [Aequorivita sp. 609]NGX83940.1 lipocalin [Aequorivita sp. KMM 9714]